MNVSEFRELVHRDIDLAATASGASPKEEFLSYAAGILINGEEFDDFNYCSYEGITKRNGNMAIDGYSMDDADGSCCIFISDYSGSNEEDSFLAEDINAAFKKIRLFVEEATGRELYFEMQGSPQAAEFARDLFYDSGSISKYRFFLITDAYNRQRARTMKADTIRNRTVELNVWDISRLYELVSSSIQKESIEIRTSNFGIPGIPCVKAVEYTDVTADIDVVPPTDINSAEKGGKSANIVSYSSWLAVVPGKLLNDLYLEYGAKLLEGNVRSFLSARGKVNKGIQSTIKNYPEMFFAYNNGIAATATEIETEMTPQGPVITKIRDLQIVNGGQTTASIANTILTAGRGETVSLDRLFVPMKISVLEHETAEHIIPKISEYSNSQNKVDASDFFSNHPFHIRMEGHSKKTAIPTSGGNQFQQYWFYERTRGQYNQGKMKFGAKSSQLKDYSDRYPEKMVITMLDLAKYMELYEGHPDAVSRGKQKMLQIFSEKIKTAWQGSDTQFSIYYWKRVVALAILYRKTDELIHQSQWYKNSRSYKANVAAYTISLIFHYIHKNHRDRELDFMRIWNQQDLYCELEDQISVLSEEVFRFITGPRDTENVTEWCKKEACWKRAQNFAWTFNDPFVRTLVSKESENEEAAEEVRTQRLATEMDVLKEILARGPEYWKQGLKWGYSRNLLSEKEISILQITINSNQTGRVPSEKQARVVIQSRERLVREGMPLQFS